ncbi:anthranilate synthase / indole-3-glycerol phosphate synthase [Batrachochytrium dendrobatidis]|nr:anthranilate synthase / indole-3-glycerol phosphate synthase [Batrachochytrium dendrobatidis]
MTTLLIDNYDSFTWNVYQLLSELGANVKVVRNDLITIDEAIRLNPRNVVISPGPGHPSTAGISNDIIRHFAGLIPILGVCLGEQCIYEIYGGTVSRVGELVHGKTTQVMHDGLYLYDGVPQNIECTRYHSLAGTLDTLPDVLTITARTASGVIMGVRHNDLVMEGVQFHPESIASESGRKLFANFLSWEGGHWSSLKIKTHLVNYDEATELNRVASAASYPGVGNGIPLSAITKLNSTSKSITTTATGPSENILEKITRQRKRDVVADMTKPGCSFLHLQRSIALGLAPIAINFKDRLVQNDQGQVAVLAEIKRASPSKGDICPSAHAATIAQTYAVSGASAISVLTEPTWFKGSLSDMLQARLAVQHITNRPAILCKDFIIDRYQILQARLHGADTLLLIVACLTDDQLLSLMSFSRQLGMEPLVEVASAEEMQRAVKLGSQVIGVNNRDLKTFSVDTSRTTELASMVPSDVVLIALSGITCRRDIEPYLAAGARGVLVGEALMKASNKHAFIGSLVDPSIPYSESFQSASMAHSQRVKICGITNTKDAIAAVDAGADFLGLIFASSSARRVDATQAAEIVLSVRKETNTHRSVTPFSRVLATSFPTYASHTMNASPEAWFMSRAADGVLPRRTPLFVGVFTTQSASEIQSIVDTVGLDLVQMHNATPDPDLPALISVPTIQVLHVDPTTTGEALLQQISSFSHRASFILLDTSAAAGSGSGGSGQVFDWSVAKKISALKIPFFLAGGLCSNNVSEAVSTAQPWCVDVCSGVEMEGKKGIKDESLMQLFVKNAAFR